jgi:glycerol-3-phosphate dehydrogenase
MGKEVIDKAISIHDLADKDCRTEDLQIHGYKKGTHYNVDSWTLYGSDAKELEKLADRHPDLMGELHPLLPYLQVEVVWAVRHEMARNLEDVLSRRTRALLLNAKAAVEIAPRVAHLMARELGKDQRWEQEQIREFEELAKGYMVEGAQDNTRKAS